MYYLQDNGHAAIGPGPHFQPYPIVRRRRLIDRNDFDSGGAVNYFDDVDAGCFSDNHDFFVRLGIRFCYRGTDDAGRAGIRVI